MIFPFAPANALFNSQSAFLKVSSRQKYKNFTNLSLSDIMPSWKAPDLVA